MVSRPIVVIDPAAAPRRLCMATAKCWEVWSDRVRTAVDDLLVGALAASVLLGGDGCGVFRTAVTAGFMKDGPAVRTALHYRSPAQKRSRHERNRADMAMKVGQGPSVDEAFIRTPNFPPDGSHRPAEMLVRTAVGRSLLARRKPGVQIPSPPPPPSQVRASPAPSRRRSLHVPAALRPQAQVTVQPKGSQWPADPAPGLTP
jgi:hypothetical protein